MELLALEVDWEAVLAWFGGWESYGLTGTGAILLMCVLAMTRAWRRTRRDVLLPPSSEFMGFGAHHQRTMPRW